MTKKEIEHLASLGKLEFNEKELAAFEKEFNDILKFVSVVENAKIDGETFVEKVNLKDLRDDNIRPSLPQAKILQNAPETDGEYFIVKKVVE